MTAIPVAVAAPARARRRHTRRVGPAFTVRVIVASLAGVGAGLLLRALEVPVWAVLAVAYPALVLVLIGTAVHTADPE